MGRRGPAPKPTALKIAAGNPGKRKLNDAEPLPPQGEIAPPDYISIEARRHWERIAPVVIAMRTLTTADVDAFARYCELLERYSVLRAFVWKKGAAGTSYRVTDDTGKKLRYIAELPQAAELRQVHRLLLQLEREFGLTAAARSRIQVEAGPVAQTAQHSKTPTDPAGDLVAFIAKGQVVRRA